MRVTAPAVEGAAPRNSGRTSTSDSHPRPGGSVVICAYTEARWGDICDAVGSVQAQLRAGDDIVLVIDHNDALLERARAAFGDLTVIPNAGTRGLSGARNTGIAAATAEIVVFLDDDARAEPGWLDLLLAPYADETVAGVGGAALPAWPDTRPDWFPPEFDWVVGCSYQGLPVEIAPVRNPIGAAMSFRRSAFAAVGGFTDGIGRIGTRPLGCEETEFGIRLRKADPGLVVLYEPRAVVRHRVTTTRATFTYFRQRCYAEGVSKAVVARHVGQESALESERTYVRRTLPAGVRRDLATPGRRRAAATTVAGLAITTFGYARGTLARVTLARPAGTQA